MKTKQPIQMIISALLLICVFNFAKGQSLLLPVPGSATSDGPTGYIDFTDPGNPQFVEFPAHYFEIATNIQGNPHLEVDLANSDVPMYEKYLGQHPMYAQSVVHDTNGEIVFFIIDYNIYNRYGEVFEDVDIMMPASLLSGYIESDANLFYSSTNNLLYGSEYHRFHSSVLMDSRITLFPISGHCNKYGLVFSFIRHTGVDRSSDVFFRTIEIIKENQVLMSNPIS